MIWFCIALLTPPLAPCRPLARTSLVYRPLAKHIYSPPSKHSQDIDASSRAFLLRIGNPESCVFGDICEAFEGPISGISADMSYIEKFLAVEASTLVRTQWCYQHRRFCNVRGGLFDATGLPCVGWSSVGLGQGLDDPTVVVWLAYLRKQRLLSTPIMLLENVRQLPTSVLEVNLPGYDIQRLQVDPSDIGWNMIRRPRSFFLCTHRDLVTLKWNVSDVYFEICRAFDGVKSTPKQALLAAPEDLKINKATSRAFVNIGTARGPTLCTLGRQNR